MIAQPVALQDAAEPAPQGHVWWVEHLAAICALTCVVLGVSVLLGWQFEAEPLMSWGAGLPRMAPNTAIGLVALGAVLVVRRWGRERSWMRVVIALLSIAVVSLGVLTLLEYGWRLDAGVGQRPYSDNGMAPWYAPGRMAANTAVCFVLLGASHLIGQRTDGPAALSAQILALLAALMALVTLFGYLLGVHGTAGFAFYTTMALHTALGVLVAALGTLFAWSDRALMPVLTNSRVGGRVVRALLGTVLVVTPLLAYLLLKGQQSGWYDAEFGLAAFALSQLVTLAAVIWGAGHVLRRVDARREEVEAARSRLVRDLEASNVRLEEAVAWRTRELRESEGRFQLAVQGTHDGIWDWNIRTDECYYSPRYKALLGWADEPFPATRVAFESRLHPDDREHNLAAMHAHFAKRAPYEVEYRLRTRSGEYSWFHARGQASWDADGRPIRFVGALRDITERKQSALALERSQRFLDAVVEGVPEPLFVKDQQHRWILFNEPFCEMMGHGRAELLGKSDPDLYPPELVARYWTEDEQAFGMNHEPLYVETLVTRPDGTSRWVLKSKRRVDLPDGAYLVGIAADITRLKEIQAKLAESEESHRLLAEHSNDLILRMTPPGILTYASAASASVLGYRPEALLGRYVPDFIHPDDQEQARRLYAEVVRQDTPRVVTCRLRSGAGLWVWTETSFRAVRDAGTRRTAQVIAVCRNVDERVRVTEALRAANEDLARYHAIEEEEKRVAKHVLDQLVRVNRGLADRVGTWILPARYFSGDVVAVAETPGGVLHVLLADGTGHGLAAALGALPAVQPFYAMSQKGFGIGTIVREMNAKIRELLPTGRFIAATVASIDSDFGMIQVWNGGNPPCLLVDDDGNLLRRFASTHLALGIVGDEEFDPHVESVKFEKNSQLIVVSDGLVDARNDRDGVFGEEMLRRWCADALPSARLVSLRSAVHGHLNYKQPDDDISIVVARCERLPATRVLPAPQGTGGVAEQKPGYRMQLALSVDQLKRADVVPALCTLLKELRLVSVHDSPVFVVLSELFNNALDHGLLGLVSGLKDQGQDLEPYLAERARRLAQLEAGSIQIGAECLVAAGQPSLRLVIRDTGEGFDFESRLEAEALAGEQRHGRGVAIVRRLCTTLEYRDEGREVEALLPLAGY